MTSDTLTNAGKHVMLNITCAHSHDALKIKSSDWLK